MHETDRKSSTSDNVVVESRQFRRSIGVLSATSINMTQMCGIGPFITIPIMVATMGGPWGHTAADVVTVLVVITAFASVFAGLLGGSRVPFNAARDRVFFGFFGRLHPRHDFPHVALLVMGVITAASSLLDLTTVINMLTTVAVLVQSIAQIAALTVLRRRQSELRRPYRQWLYPVPSLLALAGWIYVYASATVESILLSVVWIVGGIIAFLTWARINRSWPFAPIVVRETYLELQRDSADPESDHASAAPA